MLKQGDKAPDFTAKDQGGKDISLSDYAGKKLILYFYPKDDTPGCTAEACNLRDNMASLKDHGFEVLGVSMDTEAKHQKFITKYDLNFPLISDTDRKVIDAYEAWGRKKFMGKEYDGIIRKTYLIDEEGVISHIIEKVKTKAHSEQIIELINQ